MAYDPRESKVELLWDRSVADDWRESKVGRERQRVPYDALRGLDGCGGREIPSRKVRTPQGKTVGNTHSGKPAGKCHRNTRPMARPHVSRDQAKVKRCGKSAPALR